MTGTESNVSVRSPIKEPRTTGRCCPMKLSKPKLPWKWTRKSMVAATTLLTGAVFSLDMLLNDWEEDSSIWEWVLGDGGVVFYVLGFASAYAFLKCGQSTCSPSSKGKGSTTLGSPQKQRPAVSPTAPNAANAKPSLREGTLKPAVSSKPVLSFSSMKCVAEAGLERAPMTPAGSTARVNYAISQATARGDVEKAGVVLENLESEGLESDATSYNLIIRAFAKSNNRRGAEKWFHKLCARGLLPNEYSYNTLMNAYAKADDVAGVETWMEHMRANGIVATGISYAIVIHASARQGDVASAQGWLEKMIAAGLTPDCVNYNSLIHACSVCKDATGAEYWFEKLLEQGQEPTVMSYTALVDACSKSLDVQRAEKWMQRLVDLSLEPNVVSFNAMIDACARVGDIERAERWYGKMQELRVQPNAYIFSALINACAKACDVEAACAWLQRAEESGTTLDAVVYGCVINACGKAGDSQSAMKAFRQMRSQGIQTHIVVYGALARPFAYSGDWEEVESIQREMAADGIVMNDYFLYTLLLAYSRAKPRRGDRAETAFRKALSEGVKSNERIIKVLSSAVGRVRCGQMLDEFGLENPERGPLAGSGADYNRRVPRIHASHG